jgi:hypothetical protein
MCTRTIAVTSAFGLALLTIVQPPASTGGTMTGSPEAQLKTQLRNLVTAEEKFWAEHGTYTTDVSQVGMFRAKSRSTDSIWAQVLYAGGAVVERARALPRETRPELRHLRGSSI